MTDEEIEKGLQEMVFALNWGTVERAGAVSTDGSGDNKHGGVPKNIAIIQAAIDYIDRLRREIQSGAGTMNKQEEIDKMTFLLVNDIILEHTAEETVAHLAKYGIGDKKQAVKEFCKKLKDKLSLLRFCDVATTEQEYYHSALNDVTYDIDKLFTELYGG